MKSFSLVILIAWFQTSSYHAFSQTTICPIPELPADAICIEPAIKGKFYTKNIVTDFGADPSGVKNSQLAFECAARFFNINGGQGKLVIPYGNYLVGIQDFKEPTKITCPYWSDYGWIGRDVMHLVDCSNFSIAGIDVNGKKPVLRYKNELKVGGFKKDGEISIYKNNPDSKRFNMPKNCDESLSADTYQACIGATFYLDNCDNINISGVEIDGNSNQYVYGGYVGPGPSPYEVWSYGVVIWNTKNTSIQNVDIRDIGTDGVLVKNYTDEGLNTKNYNIILDRMQVINSGRNNISWIGGNGLVVKNSSLEKASTGKIKTDPGASIDIEPELHAQKSDRCHSILDTNKKNIMIYDHCFNGNFTNIYIYEDRLFGLLNADRTRHSKNITAKNIKVINSSSSAYYSVTENIITFTKSKIIGKWVINEKKMPLMKYDPKTKKSIFKLK